MEKLANLGYDCFLPQAFGNDAYYNVDGANSAIRKYNAIEVWIIAAHGSACEPAASFITDYPEKVQGVIWLGGYSEQDLSSLPLCGLSIIGSNDTVINREQWEKAKSLAPSNMEYQTIEGANHSGFADIALMYGDSDAEISFDEQTDESVRLIHDFLLSEF